MKWTVRIYIPSTKVAILSFVGMEDDQLNGLGHAPI